MAAGKDPGNAHFWLSMIKSGVRIVGCLILCNGLFLFAGGFLLLAEVIGIAEELVD
tara:strand:- start:165 stop:332 length:168 start_codon:yes stop_codon:yes gene_type:complete